MLHLFKPTSVSKRPQQKMTSKVNLRLNMTNVSASSKSLSLNIHRRMINRIFNEVKKKTRTQRFGYLESIEIWMHVYTVQEYSSRCSTFSDESRVSLPKAQHSIHIIPSRSTSFASFLLKFSHNAVF